MKKTVLIVALILVSSTAMAGWVRVGIGSDGGTTYVDKTTIRKMGSNRVKMWSLTDYKAPQNAGSNRYLSRKSLDEYDCNERQDRMVYLVSYSGNMGRGGPFDDMKIENSEWSPDAPGTLGEATLKIACGEK